MTEVPYGWVCEYETFGQPGAVTAEPAVLSRARARRRRRD